MYSLINYSQKTGFYLFCSYWIKKSFGILFWQVNDLACLNTYLDNNPLIRHINEFELWQIIIELFALFSTESNSAHTKANRRGYNKIFGDTCLYLMEIKFLTWKIVTALLPIVTYSCVIYQVSIYVTYKKLCSRQKLSYHCHIHK